MLQKRPKWVSETGLLCPIVCCDVLCFIVVRRGVPSYCSMQIVCSLALTVRGIVIAKSDDFFSKSTTVKPLMPACTLVSLSGHPKLHIARVTATER